MKRVRVFAARNSRELLRDPVSLVFCIGLPVGLLVLMTIMQRNMPVDLFPLENFTPGIALFSLTFLSLFSGTLIASDRSSALLSRLFASPLTAAEFILGYALPLVPMALAQMAICYGVSFLLGLAPTWRVLLSMAAMLPAAVLFIGLGLLLGSVLGHKQVPPITSILVQMVALSSGTWFDLNLLGGTLRAICYAMPFAHALDAARGALTGQTAGMGMHLLVCTAYAIPVFVLAILAFRKKMRGESI